MIALWLGILLVAVGIFLPWVEVHSALGGGSVTGWDLNQGLVTIGAGIAQVILGAVAAGTKINRKLIGGATLIASIVIIVIAVNGIMDIEDARSQARSFFGTDMGRLFSGMFGAGARPQYEIGIGIILTLVGGVLTALGGLIFLIKRH